MAMRTFLTITLLVFGILMLCPNPKALAAADTCGGIGPETVIRWDSGQLLGGQIGRLTILKDTLLYRPDGEEKIVARQLKVGESYRIYAFKQTSLSVGGGLYVDRDGRVRYETPSKAKLNLLKCKAEALENSHQSIKMNDSFTAVTAKLGSQKRVSLNEYQLNWYTYHQSYDRFYMVSYINSRVTGMFTMDPRYFYKNIHVGSSLNDVNSSLGKPITYIRKKNIDYIQTNNKELQTYVHNGHYITVFFDLHGQGKVTGIQVISNVMEERKGANYAQPTPKLQNAFEMQMFDLINAARVANELQPLKWDERARTASRKHSLDMAVNHYFEHVNRLGQTPFQRMEAEGIRYRAAGENIATGFSSSIFAHEAFMNSLGHRENLLNPFYTHVGVGVQFQAGTKCPFYTQDYFTP